VTLVRLARWIFLVAGISGILLIVPPFFLEGRAGEDYPPPITHAEYYYGFLGVTLAWQFVYLLIGSDPIRYRPAMLTGVLAKGSYVVTIVALYLAGRVPAILLGFVSFDATWTVLFVVAYLRTPQWKGGPHDHTR
jgi:hypothetical protein